MGASQSDVLPCPKCGEQTITMSFSPRDNREPIVTDAFATEAYLGDDLVVRRGWQVHACDVKLGCGCSTGKRLVCVVHCGGHPIPGWSRGVSP